MSKKTDAIVILEKHIRARIITRNRLKIVEVGPGCIDKVKVVPIKDGFRYKIEDVKDNACPVCKNDSDLPHETYVYDGYLTCKYDYWNEKEFVPVSKKIEVGDFVKSSYGIGKVRKIYSNAEFFKKYGEAGRVKVVGLMPVFGKRYTKEQNKVKNDPIVYVTWKGGDYYRGGWRFWELSKLVPMKALKKAEKEVKV